MCSPRVCCSLCISALQVLNDEPGLADCWFPGKVAETSGVHLLVVYNNLQDEDGGQPLREWFPLPGSQHDLTIETAHTVHTDSRRYQVRPAPHIEVRINLYIAGEITRGMCLSLSGVPAFLSEYASKCLSEGGAYKSMNQ